MVQDSLSRFTEYILSLGTRLATFIGADGGIGEEMSELSGTDRFRCRFRELG